VTESLEEQVAEAWREARERAAAAGRPLSLADYPTISDPAVAWAEKVNGVIREYLDAEYSPEFVAARFRIPADYDAFQRIDGQMWQSSGKPEWLVCNSQEVGPVYHNDVIPRRDGGLWLMIANSFEGELSWLMLCCDHTHPLFGAVVAGYDAGDPYADGVPSPKCRVVAPSFLEFLRTAEGFWPPHPLPVPPPPPETNPVPLHLRDWLTGVTFEDEYLKGTVRCPCGCEQMELRTLGKTHSDKDGSPFPVVEEIDGEWYFIVEAKCAGCGREHVLFDNNRHGTDGFRGPKPGPTPPPRPLVSWKCIDCSSQIHTAEVLIVSDYEDRYFECKYHLEYGIDKWPEMFGWIDIRIACCKCGRRTGWVSYETR
jgi:hypothetical protein